MGTRHVSFRAKPEMEAKISRVQNAMGYSSQSEAIRWLIQTGYNQWKTSQNNHIDPEEFVENLPNKYKSGVKELMENPNDTALLQLLAEYARKNSVRSKVQAFRQKWSTKRHFREEIGNLCSTKAAKIDRLRKRRANPRTQPVEYQEQTERLKQLSEELKDHKQHYKELGREINALETKIAAMELGEDPDGDKK